MSGHREPPTTMSDHREPPTTMSGHREALISTSGHREPPTLLTRSAEVNFSSRQRQALLTRYSPSPTPHSNYIEVSREVLELSVAAEKPRVLWYRHLDSILR